MKAVLLASTMLTLAGAASAQTRAGAPAGVALKDPTTSALPAGCSYASNTVTCSGGNVQLSGYDFATHGTQLVLNGGGTISGNSFAMTGCQDPLVVINGTQSVAFSANTVTGKGCSNASFGTQSTNVNLSTGQATTAPRESTPSQKAGAGQSATSAGGQTTTSPQTITPGQGTLTDAAGNVWTITQSGSIKEGASYTPGGGGTSALMIVNGTVYGEDSSGRGWFALSGDGQYWSSVATPATTATNQTTPANQTQGLGTPTTPSQGTSTQTVTIPPPSCGSATSKQFGILPLTQSGTGQIIDSSGTLFVPRGVNVMNGSGNPAAATLKATFPGINFVRLAIYHYDSPDSLAPYINDLTSNGIVVELEDHNNNAGGAGGGQGVIFSGQTLTNESSWYASVASYFKSNPYVWFGTNNEPSVKNAQGQTDPAALSQWQRATYDAIRGTGNQSIIFLETVCWTEGGKPVCNQGYDSSAYAGMSNVAWDSHVYGWLTNFNTDQATNDQFVADNVATLANIKSAGNTIMPVVIAEYGNSTTGQAIDPNGTQVVSAVNKSVSSGGAAGASAWAWGPGNPGDGLTNGGSGLSSYGQQVASAMTQGAPVASVCQGSANQTAQGATSQTTTLQSEPAAGTTSISLTQGPPAAATQPDTGSTTPTLTTTDPTANPTYVQAASGAATSAAQATSAAVAAGQARMKGN